MVNKKNLIFSFVGLFLLMNVSAMSVDYYYSPNCMHCQKIAPFMSEITHNYKNIIFNFFNTLKTSYDIQGTPTLIIKTDDKREISLTGSYEIPKNLECELNEMSTLDCPTTTYLNSTTNSFFIR